MARLMWKLDSVCLDIFLILMQNSCTVCVERTRGSVIILYALDRTIRWHGSCGISFRSVWRYCYYRCKIGAWFARNVTQAHKSFWMLLMVLLGDVAQVEARCSPSEIVLIMKKHRCMVCAERTIASEVVLDAPDGTPRWHGSCGISFWSIWRQCRCRCKMGARFALNIPKA
jgi:hypothetical protein